MPLSEHVYCVAVAFKMTEPAEQRTCVKFCVKLEHSSMEPIQKAFRYDAIGTAQIQVCQKHFKDG